MYFLSVLQPPAVTRGFLFPSCVMISIFETKHFVFSGRDGDGNAITRWATQLVFFEGDLSNIDPTTDTRFVAVSKVRKQSKFMGTVSSLIFPVEYPIITNDGLTLGGYEALKYEVEADYNASI